MLQISNLSVDVDNKTILKSIDLDVQGGQILALLGPNGSGKSTLASALIGNPTYTVKSGTITLDQQEITDLEPEDRAITGLFVSFQSPVSLPGVKITTFLRAAVNARRVANGESPIEIAPFIKELRAAFETVGLPADFAGRAVNEGFSGGERKRLELAQALLFQPKVVVFDEIDSGLDLDAVKIVARVVGQLKKNGQAVIVITHYPELLKTVSADRACVLIDGQIVASGDLDLVEQISQHGFDQFRT